MKNIILSSLLVGLSFSGQSQAPSIQWKKCYGGSLSEFAHSISQTFDGGYIIGGYTNSNDSNVNGNHSSQIEDYWLIKIDSLGTLEWQKCLGGSSSDQAYSVIQTIDSGYVVAGYANSIDGDVTGSHGGVDFWVVKLDVTGTIQWQKALGGTMEEKAFSLQQTSDGGYIILGETTSNDGDVSGFHGGVDFWVVKLDNSGNIQWEKCYGGSSQDIGRSIIQTNDGGYIFCGDSKSDDGDLTGHQGTTTYTDYWIVKTDNVGTIQWQKNYGSIGFDWCYSILQSTDNNYLVAGCVNTDGGDVTGYKGLADFWILKLDPNGNLLWQKCFGGSSRDEAYSISKASDGGFIIAGESGSNDYDVTGAHGSLDYWVVKLDSAGNIQWQKCLGGTLIDKAWSIIETTDGGYAVAGETKSTNGDVTGYVGGLADYWVVKLAPMNVGIDEQENSLLTLYPNPTHTSFTIVNNSLSQSSILQISNALGKIVYSKKVTGGDSQIDDLHLAAGYYIVEVFSEKEKFVSKLVVQ